MCACVALQKQFHKHTKWLQENKANGTNDEQSYIKKSFVIHSILYFPKVLEVIAHFRKCLNLLCIFASAKIHCAFGNSMWIAYES